MSTMFVPRPAFYVHFMRLTAPYLQNWMGFMNANLSVVVAAPFPPLIRKPIVNSRFRSPTESDHIFVPSVDLCPVENHRGSFPTHAGPLFSVHRMPPRVPQPVCSRERPVPGVYRPVNPLDWRGNLVAHRGYVWEPEPACVSGEWSCSYSYRCCAYVHISQRMDALPYYDNDQREVRQVLSRHKRSILFLGDSHDRYAYYCEQISVTHFAVYLPSYSHSIVVRSELYVPGRSSKLYNLATLAD